MFEPAAGEGPSDQPTILKFDRSATPKSSGRLRHPGGNRLANAGSRIKRADQETLGQYIPLIYHYNMLQDEDRVGAFADAINLLVQPHMNVVELGAGTGILSSLAARRGANVLAVERNPELVACARKFIAANGLKDRIRVISDDASCWVPEQRVDVVICEMLHVGLLREKQAQVIAAFKKNYLDKFGGPLPVFIPEVSILMFQPVHQSFEFAGFNAPVPMFQAPLLDQPRTRELAGLQAYETITFHQPIPQAFDVCMKFEATEAGVLNAMRLVTQNVLTIDEANQRAVTWPNQCLVLPIEHPFTVQHGQQIELRLKYEAGGPIEEISFDAYPVASQYYENVG